MFLVWKYCLWTVRGLALFTVYKSMDSQLQNIFSSSHFLCTKNPHLLKVVLTLIAKNILCFHNLSSLNRQLFIFFFSYWIKRTTNKHIIVVFWLNQNFREWQKIRQIKYKMDLGNLPAKCVSFKNKQLIFSLCTTFLNCSLRDKSVYVLKVRFGSLSKWTKLIYLFSVCPKIFQCSRILSKVASEIFDIYPYSTYI